VEAAETQVWLEMAQRCGYVSDTFAAMMDDRYDHIMSQIVLMIENADSWLVT
jgi:hypothetical protein